MSRDEIQKLIGGYATGTLTPAEQEALFAAALDDQELFDTLAREQPLRDLLRDPTAKAHVLASLEAKPKTAWATWWRPAAVGFALTALTVVVVRQIPPKPDLDAVAVVKPQAAPVNQPPAAPAPVPPAPAESQPTAKDTGKATPKENEVAVAREEVREKKKVAANEVRREADQVGSDRDQRASAEPKTAPPPAPAAPPPPPVKAEPPAVQELAAANSASPKRADAAGGRARQSARSIFLSRQLADQMMTTRFVESTGAPGQQGQAQGQLRQQSPYAQQQQQQSAVRESVAVSADSKMLAPAPQPGVRYTIAGSSVRLEANDYGTLFVMARAGAGGWRNVLSVSTQPGQVQVTTALRPDEKEVHVSFMRTLQMAKAGPVPPQPGVDPATNLVEQDGETTYVVNPLTGPAGQNLTFTIRLP